MWTSNVEETPYDCAKKIYEVIVKNGDHMYPGNTKYTRLKYTTNLLKFKNYSHCSNRALIVYLYFLWTLPKKQTLLETYYDMKKDYEGFAG